MKNLNLDTPFLLIILFSIILSLWSCHSYSPFNRIYKAHDKIETKEDFATAEKLLKKVEKKKRGKKNIEKNKVGFYYNKARVSFEKRKYSEAKKFMDKIIEDYKELSDEDKKSLKIKNIDGDELDKFYKDILNLLPRQITKPIPKSKDLEGEYKKKKEEYDKEMAKYIKVKKETKEYLKVESSISNVYDGVISKMRKDDIPFPENSKFKIERKGKLAEDIVLKYEYGDTSTNANNDYANVDMSAFGRGKYITASTKKALFLFERILIEFVESEKEVNYDSVRIDILGSADGHPVNKLYYNGEFGDISNEKYKDENSGKDKEINLVKSDSITNESLAFLRAYHPKYTIRKVDEFLNSDFNINVIEKIDTGAVHRKVLIEIYMKNAYKLKLERLSGEAKTFVEAATAKNDSFPPPPVAPLVLPPTQTPDPQEYKGKKTAIIIGVSDYKNLSPASYEPSPNELKDLSFADDDAEDFADLIENGKYSGGGWDIFKFTDSQATKEKIIPVLQEVLYKSSVDDLIFIFFSGHGISHPQKRNEVYLLPYEYDEKKISYTSLKYEDLLDWVGDANAKHVILFIDACRSGSVGIGKGSNTNFGDDFIFERIKSFPETKVILSSSQGSQISYEHGDEIQNGLFTYYLLEGLYGKSENLNNDGFVDLEEVYRYVRNKVEDKSFKLYGRFQTPNIIQFENNIDYIFPLTNRYN